MREIDVLGTIRDFRPDESYILSYGIDFPFYEGYFLPQLQRLGCKKNVVIVDGDCFNREIELSHESLRVLGKEYVLLPIYSSYTFHPKVYLFKRIKNKQTNILCIIGSGNLTYPGLNTNYELFSSVEWDGRNNPPLLLGEIYKYIYRILDQIKGETPKLAKEWLQEKYPVDFIDDKKVVDHILEFPAQEGIYAQFLRRIYNQRIKKLIFMAPFFDKDLSVLQEIISNCNPKETYVIIQDDTVSMSLKALEKIKNKTKSLHILKFESKKDSKRYLHGKLLIAQADKLDHILFGSANLSHAAMFGKKNVGNYEVSIYTQLPIGNLPEELEIFKKTREVSLQELVIKDIEAPKFKKENVSSIKLVSVEFHSGKLWFLLSSNVKKEIMEFELLTLTGPGNTISATKQKDAFVASITAAEHIEKIIAARISENKVANKNEWIPVQFIGTLRNFVKIPFARIEEFKYPFLHASEEREEFQYLSNMIDYLIGEWRKRSEQDAGERKKRLVQKRADSEPTKREVVIRIGEEIIKHEPRDTLVGMQGGISDIFTYILRALREKKYGETLQQEVLILDEGEILEEPAEPVKKEEKIMPAEKRYINTIEEISKTLRRWRRLFMTNDSIADFMSRICLFGIIALPHIPKLNKCYQVNRERKECITTEDWCEYIARGIYTIGNLVFAESSKKEVWPDFRVDLYQKDTFEESVASLFYAIITAYPFLVRRASESFGLDSRPYKMTFGQLHILCAFLLKVVSNTNENNLSTFEEKVNLIMDCFPCEQAHFLRSIEEFRERIKEYAIFDYRKKNIQNICDIGWQDGIGFFVKSVGENVSLFTLR